MLLAVACRVEPVVTHPAPPQTRTCAIHAYGSSSRASAAHARTHLAPQSPGVPWSGLVSSKSLPCLRPVEALPDVAFPPVGRLGLTSPPSSVLCAATTATLSLSGCFACRSQPRYLAGFLRSWSPFPARRPVEAPGPRQGFWSPGPPVPALVQGDRWLSQVPEFPLWLHAPLSDPGGVLDTRHAASRTAAFRRLQTVGFPLESLLRDILFVHDYTHFGAQSRGLRPRYTRLRTAPYGEARGFAPDRLARRLSGRT